MPSTLASFCRDFNSIEDVGDFPIAKTLVSQFLHLFESLLFAAVSHDISAGDLVAIAQMALWPNILS